AAVVGAPVNVGATWSSFTVADAEAVPPGLVALQVKVTPAVVVSVERVTGSQPVLDVSGASGSVAVNVTVAGELFHPAAFGGGSTSVAIAGGVESDSTEPVATVAPLS